MYLHIYIFTCLFVCFIVCICDHVRTSVSGLLRPFLSCGFYPLKSSFIHSLKTQLKQTVNFGKSRSQCTNASHVQPECDMNMISKLMQSLSKYIYLCHMPVHTNIIVFRLATDFSSYLNSIHRACKHVFLYAL